VSTEVKKEIELEIAYVLFIDIVGYSKLLTDEQSEALQELNQIVRNTEAVREAEAARQLIILPTGDGMALVFTGSVEGPAECALEVSRALRAQPSLPVRMGIHSGPVQHVRDANTRENVSGVGINIARRVMDCGDAGHILVSKRFAGDLAQHPGVTRRKGLSPVARAIFIIAALILALAIVSVIFAPAIMRSVDKNRATSAPQPSATASPSFTDAIQNMVKQRITDELQKGLSGKSNAPTPKVTPTPKSQPTPSPRP
jgi:hypothetical protein